MLDDAADADAEPVAGEGAWVRQEADGYCGQVLVSRRLAQSGHYGVGFVPAWIIPDAEVHSASVAVDETDVAVAAAAVCLSRVCSCTVCSSSTQAAPIPIPKDFCLLAG